MVKIKTDSLLVWAILIVIVVSLICVFFIWEWSLIRDVAIAFMPVYSAEALAWLGVVFSFGLPSRYVKKYRSDD